MLFLPLVLSAAVSARDKVENWSEVRSPHFVVATNSSEKQARRIADQFERMRSVFHVMFPKLQIDPDAPIIVIAIKDEKEFRGLEPEAYLAKGQLKLGGLFLRAADKNYVLMRVDAEGEHPYSVIYHEYTHLLLAKAAEWMPLWLNEGFAEFYQNTDIHDKDVAFGQPSAGNIELLRQRRLLPLPTLFAVDSKSPYYHEEDKGSIFYAESWALMHYIQIEDFREKTNRLAAYVDLLAKKVDPLTAASTAFGDLKRLQDSLFAYIQQVRFSSFGRKTATEVDESAFQARPLTTPQANALCADFLAYNQRTKDARALLDGVLQADPNNVSAHETMGFLEFRQGHIDEAKKWYAGAVQLDSQSYLAHYYFAVMSMQSSLGASEQSQVENSLRQAIKLNPSFAPGFDRLAVLLGSHLPNLDEAHTMGLTAVSLDPGNVGYRINVANVLMAMQRGQSAVEVLRVAEKLAKTPEESQFVENALMHAQEYAARQEQMAQQKQRMAEEAVNEPPSPSGGDIPRLVHRAFVPNGPHRFVTGVLQDVHCDSSIMDLSVKAGAKTTAFHSDNYYRIQFSTLGFHPNGALQPCHDLEGRPAKIEYVESANKGDAARLVSIELHK
ncbi:MAG TPA: tetratricopeptide repeat protein [Candidatus Sulfotelmatobacter sp.]|nr:tetratricopeptide repeat protein [Candidatus Sulfotelmatobacter sp.]